MSKNQPHQYNGPLRALNHFVNQGFSVLRVWVENLYILIPNPFIWIWLLSSAFWVEVEWEMWFFFFFLRKERSEKLNEHFDSFHFLFCPISFGSILGNASHLVWKKKKESIGMQVSLAPKKFYLFLFYFTGARSRKSNT